MKQRICVVVFLSLCIGIIVGCENTAIESHEKNINEIIEESGIQYGVLIEYAHLDNDEGILVFYEYDNQINVDYIKKVQNKWSLQRKSIMSKNPLEKLSWSFQVFHDVDYTVENQIFYGLVWDEEINKVDFIEDSIVYNTNLVNTSQEYRLWYIVRDKTDNKSYQANYQFIAYSKDGTEIVRIN